ncbi:transglycosylase domain-containing protein [Alkalicoccobacillus plakortidis]|uniref:Transglycosylase domain-containing protein n=1 Tax=Alkalicoccobacillus plakortidis TaxID=444060 RepID=A0ABT0XHD6_9BACI|nr:transglycosylase domain-containing protein [Alkalicoccobacillus plakortidis]MCM2675304.1 transglycosylase domain-containing protein [Alkalicoccobacillus plakortidis]
MSMFSRIKERIHLLYKKLDDIQLFRRIGITYQVFWNLFLVFIVFGIMSLFFVGGTAAGYFASLVKDEPLQNAEEMTTKIHNYEETSQVFFAGDTYMGELPTDLERHQVALDDISDYVKKAIVATEDEYFYEHEGVVPKAIMRATYQEFANASTQTGGSTLTQQLIKQQILSSEVSFDRKATEILLAMRLEHFMSKDDILEAYLNVVPFGRNASGNQIAGVQSAAIGIFGVDAKDLNLPQSAFIAGLPQSPFGYTPFQSDGEVKESIDPALNRMNTVLSRMHSEGYISDEEMQDALDYDIQGDFTDRTPPITEKYHYLTYEIMKRATPIIAEAKMEADDVNLDEMSDAKRAETIESYTSAAARDLSSSGYRIHTSINQDIYDGMQDAVNDDNLFGPEKEGENEEVGAVLQDNKTGAILGFVGGREEGNPDKQFNHATQANRPTGSTMKPLLGYAPAMEIGTVQPGLVIPDTPMKYKSNGKPINNFDRSHKGLQSVRKSLAQSRNVPAVRALNTVPHDVARQTLKDLGIPLADEGVPHESSVLGTVDMSVEENTNAYSTFGNGGKRVESYMIERIETADGESVFEHEAKETDVFSVETNYLTIDMMRDVLKPGGTASSVPGNLNFSADWAGKTGTTQYTRDSWFMATNPNVTLGVWIGYDSNHTISETVNGLRYGPRNQKIWANIANAAYSANSEIMAPSESFKQPEGVVSRKICSLTGTAPSKACEDADLVTTDLFNKKFLPNSKDDLKSERYVTINGKNYKARSQTPEEFTERGISISKDLFGVGDISSYLPDSINGVVGDQEAPDNGNTPGKVSGVSLDGSSLKWSKHDASDIVGYRIYRADNGSDDFKSVQAVKGNESTDFNVGGGKYAFYVTAVDSVGNESSASDIVKANDWKSKEDAEKEEEEKEKEKEKEEKEKEEAEQDDNDASDNDEDQDSDEDSNDDENSDEESNDD